MAKGKLINELDDADIFERLTEAKSELFNLRFQFATGQLDDSTAIKKTKKNIARLLTELRSREIAAAEVQQRTRQA